MASSGSGPAGDDRGGAMMSCDARSLTAGQASVSEEKGTQGKVSQCNLTRPSARSALAKSRRCGDRVLGTKDLCVANAQTHKSRLPAAEGAEILHSRSWEWGSQRKR
jgi:hypothetical protein